jgi:hypothetical protein
MLPAWLWIGSPLKAWLWAVNRLGTWTGMFLLWKRRRSARFIWVWMVLINAASWGGLCLVFFWLHHRGIAP